MFERTERYWKTLREHPAFRVAAVYSGTAFVLLQVMDLLGFATSTVRWTGVLLAVAGVVMVVVLAMAHHHLTPLIVLARVPRGRRLVLALVLMLTVGTGAWWAGSRLVAAPVAPGAEAIAVLPFTASGAGVGELGEGMVDLLSTLLDEVGGVRAIHPRTVLHRWSRYADNGNLDLDGALAVGRDVGAGSVLLGSLVGAGDRIRVTAELYSLDGRRMGEARVEGDAAGVLGLVDELAVRILREVWRSREPLPGLRLEAITTSSVDALQHYLRGERHYRGARWDSARVALQEAVASDSTFALAHLRLGEVLGWIHHHGHPDNIAAARTAGRFAERLPARERSLVRVDLLHSEADLAAVDSAESYVRRYPDDAMGWALLADIRYHAQIPLGVSLDDVVAPVDSLHRLDPGLSGAFVHPMELAYLAGDSVLYDRSLARYEAAGGDPFRWQRQRATAWSTPDSMPARFARDFRELEVERGPGASWYQWASIPIFRPDMDPALTDRLAAGIIIGERPGTTADHMAHFRVALLVTRGRVQEALDEARQGLDRGLGPWTLFEPLYIGAIAGVVPPGDVEPFVPIEPGGPPLEWYQRILALAAGDVDAAHVPDMRPDAQLPDEAPPWVPAVLTALHGWELILRGDADTGLDLVRQGVITAGYSFPAILNTTGPHFHAARHMARTNAHRDEAIRRLEAIRLRTPPWYLVPTSVALAEAYEARGDTARAIHHYAEIVRLWTDADPHLQGAVESARRAITRLGGVER
jgi:TolB-like protein